MFKIFLSIFIFQLQYAIAGQNPEIISRDSLLKTDSAKSFNLTITSNVENAKIYFDTAFIGLTPLTDYAIKEGYYKIKIYNPRSLKDWENENKLINLFIESDTAFTVSFRHFYYFNSTPFDADVFSNDSMLGSTPLRLFEDYELTGNLIFKKKNYKDYIYDLKNYDFEKGVNLSLESKGTETISDLVYKDRVTQFKTKRSLISIGALAAASLAGGYFAINFKNKSNAEYDNYLATGNAAYLSNSNSQDTYFVISLILMQAAIGGLIYFLFFDK